MAPMVVRVRRPKRFRERLQPETKSNRWRRKEAR